MTKNKSVQPAKYNAAMSKNLNYTMLLNKPYVVGKTSWPPEWFATFKSTFICKSELAHTHSDFFYPTTEIREHAKAMALLMGLKIEESYSVLMEGAKFPYKLRIHHDQ